MISDITIGQYFPGDSLFYKLDARMKIVLTVLLIVSIFLCGNITTMAAIIVVTILLVLISKVPVKSVLKSIKPLMVIILFTAVLNIFYGQGDALIEFGRFKITADGIKTAVFMAVRIMTLVVISSLLTYTTSPTELTDALERLFKPLKIFKVDVHSIAMTMTIALRFIPTLLEEVEKIMAAQKSRGADMDSGNLLHRAKALVPVLIPLFVSSFRRANELAYAMECRCYRGGEGRTKMKVLKLGVRDYISLAVVICFMAAVIMLNYFVKGII